MSEEEIRADEATPAATAGAEPGDGEKGKKPKKPKKKWSRNRKIGTWVTVAVIVVVACFGFLQWHEQPSFCSAICHNPMDPYLPTYEATMGQPAVDKWGNEVKDASSMLATVHKTAGKNCLDCHVPTIPEQMNEGTERVSGNYVSPLEERDSTWLLKARGITDDDKFCMNGTCHNFTREDLAKKTEWMGVINPHVNQHGKQKCTTCHKAHRASVMYCTQCHTEAVVPDGWLSYSESQELVQQQAQLHEG